FFRMTSCGMIAPRSGGQASLWQFRVEFENGASPTLRSMQHLGVARQTLQFGRLVERTEAKRVIWAIRRFLSPLQGFRAFCSLTQGGARFTSLALGYHLSGFQPFQFEPPHVGC